MKKRAALGVSILSILCFVNPKAFATNDLFHRLETEIKTHGKPDSAMTGKLASDLGVPDGSSNVEEDVLADATVDSLSHGAMLLTHDGTTFIVLQSKRKERFRAKSHFFTIDSGGKLLRTTVVEIRYDKAGRAIPGSAKVSHVDSWRAKRAYRHELDFWLKGKYRRHPGDVLNRPRTSTTTEPATPQSMPGPHVSKP